MKKIVIYAQNEEMAALKPLAQRISKKGANHVTFSAIRYLEANPKAQLVLTLRKYLEKVKKLYEPWPGIPVMAIEDVDDEAPIEATPPVSLAEVTKSEPEVVVEATHEPEVVQVIDDTPETSSADDEVIVMTVSEADQASTTSRRRRTAKEE